MAVIRHQRRINVREARAEAATPTTATRVARPARVTRTVSVTPAVDTAMQAIALNMKKIEDLQQENLRLKSEVEALMLQGNLTTHDYKELRALFKDQYTSRQRFIDPQKLYNTLKEKDFFACIKVQMEPLSKVLSENEINKIAKTTEPVKKGTEFIIERTKQKATKK